MFLTKSRKRFPDAALPLLRFTTVSKEDVGSSLQQAASDIGGGIFNHAGNVVGTTLTSTLIASSTNGDCGDPFGTVTDGDHNLIGDAERPAASLTASTATSSVWLRGSTPMACRTMAAQRTQSLCSVIVLLSERATQRSAPIRL